jgi:hypothetical protein
MNETRVKEPEIQVEILRLLADGKIWAISNIIRALRLKISLSPADRARANERHTEEKWEQSVRNALAPSRKPSLTTKEFVEIVARDQYVITTLGREKLRFHNMTFEQYMNSPEFKKFFGKS